MNSIQKRILFGFSIVSLLLSSCGTGQLFGPTITPSATPTRTSTSTPSPTLTPTETLTPTVTSTPTPEAVQWDISPQYVETINSNVMDILPIQVSLETDLTRGGLKYGIRNGWNNNFGQSADKSLAEMWARAIFEAWWYNKGEENEPISEDFKNYVQTWSKCLQTDPSGKHECWEEIQLEVVANDLHTSDYDPKKITINPPTIGRIIFTGDSEQIRNISRKIGTCEDAYGTNYLDGVLIVYVGKPEGCNCRSRSALLSYNMVNAMTRLQTRRAFSTGDVSPSESIYAYVSKYKLTWRGSVSDSRYILEEKFRHIDC
jgi:hypothetical protein